MDRQSCPPGNECNTHSITSFGFERKFFFPVPVQPCSANKSTLYGLIGMMEIFHMLSDETPGRKKELEAKVKSFQLVAMTIDRSNAGKFIDAIAGKQAFKGRIL